jgi:hypothetical protein
MPDLTAKRTLVKSPPELWEELSEVEGLTKHLGAFGEIKITKLEPEHTVAWEGEHGSGTVSIEPSGWGTKVTLHAELLEAEPNGAGPETAAPEREPKAAEAEPEPVAGEPEAVADEPEPVADEPEPVATQVEPKPLVTEPEPPVAEAEPPVIQPEPPVTNPAPVVTEEPVLFEAVSLPNQDPKPRRRGFWGWLFRPRTSSALSEPEPTAAQPDPKPAVTHPEPVVTEYVPVVTEPEPEPVAVRAAEEREEEPQPVAVEAERREEEPEPVAVEAVGRREEDAEDTPDVGAEEDSSAGSAPLDPDRARVVLDEALDALGSAHHRPFSRG